MSEANTYEQLAFGPRPADHAYLALHRTPHGDFRVSLTFTWNGSTRDPEVLQLDGLDGPDAQEALWTCVYETFRRMAVRRQGNAVSR